MNILPNNQIEFTTYNPNPSIPPTTVYVPLQHIKHIESHVCIWINSQMNPDATQTLEIQHTLVTNQINEDIDPIFGYVPTIRYRLNQEEALLLTKYLAQLTPHQVNINVFRNQQLVYLNTYDKPPSTNPNDYINLTTLQYNEDLLELID